MTGYTLPAGYYAPSSRVQCPECGKPLVLVDDIEGLPIRACPDRCRIVDGAQPTALTSDAGDPESASLGLLSSIPQDQTTLDPTKD